MNTTLSINGREAELSLSVMDRGDRVSVFATVGFIKEHCNGYKTVSHAVYSDFARYYNTTDRPKRMTQAFKNRLLDSVYIDTVKRDVYDHYNTAA